MLAPITEKQLTDDMKKAIDETLGIVSDYSTHTALCLLEHAIKKIKKEVGGTKLSHILKG